VSYSLILPRIFVSSEKRASKTTHTRQKWKYNVQMRFAPLHKKRIDLIDTADVLSVLEPDWLRFQVAI
jgi:hypothetical protein